MSLHVIVGAGPVGRGTAELLARAGHEVRVITRSGAGPRQEGVRLIATDAADADSLARFSTGASAIYNCANPPYHRWATDWPPLADSLLTAATTSGAVLVTMGNLYGYGPPSRALVESDPLAATGTKGMVRARMWSDALEAHRAGRVRVTEARASDFFGPGLTATSHFGERMVPRLLDGRTVRVIGRPDVAHTWTYIDDVARTLVVLGSEERAWGRAWHVPSNPARTQAALIGEFCRLAGVPMPKIGGIPHLAMRAVGIMSPMIRELEETRYQFVAPFVMDSTACTDTFGIQATPMDTAISETIAWWRHRALAAA
ncbi:MAG: NAD-dependent epimerase/dehydratase family protein [Acidimicrobiales bacterium]